MQPSRTGSASWRVVGRAGVQVEQEGTLRGARMRFARNPSYVKEILVPVKASRQSPGPPCLGERPRGQDGTTNLLEDCAREGCVACDYC